MNIELPCVCLTVNSLNRDNDRVFNKNNGFYYNQATSRDSPVKNTTKYREPTPIDIGVSVSIMTKYQLDLDQIISNFVPYTNPYIVLSWTIPDEFNLRIPQEIRSTVFWDGTISIESPLDKTGSDKSLYVADANFTIKAWLFKDDVPFVGNIYEIKTNFYTERLITDYEDLSGKDYDGESLTDKGLLTTVDRFVVSGAPSITNYFYNGSEVDYNRTVNSYQTGKIVFYGCQFDYTRTILLSTNNTSILPSITSIGNFPKQPPVSGYPIEIFNRLTNNVIEFDIPALSGNGERAVFVILNTAGYSTTFEATSSYIVLR